MYRKIRNILSQVIDWVRHAGALPLYPLLLAVFPILFLYNHNIAELSIGVVTMPILVAIILACLAMLVINFIIRNWHKTALIVAMALLIFYFYQPVVLMLPHSLFSLGGIEITRGKIVLPAVLMAFIALFMVLFLKKQINLHKLTQPLNLLFVLLAGFSLVQIGSIEFQRLLNGSEDHQVIAKSQGDVADKPDVYYFIFDRYAGEHTLREYYNYDNSPFLDELEKKGFYIAGDSYTNYPSTELSIASSLSMDYLESNEQAGRKQDFTTDVYPRIWNSQAVKQFKDLGYQYFQVSSRYMPTAYSNVADRQFIPSNPSKLNIDEFTFQLLQTTLVNAVGDKFLNSVVNLDYYQAFLNAHKYQREVLPKVIELPGPKVVFAHVLLPHDPHVVDGNCQTIPESQFTMSTDLPAYLDQLECANTLALEWIDLIKKDSDNQAIIMLHADEGPYPMVHKLPQQKNFSNASTDAIKERASILNAFYFPDQDYSQLYQSITPVNNFRTVLRQYFDVNIENLPDKTYVFPSEKRMFDFIDVTSSLET